MEEVKREKRESTVCHRVRTDKNNEAFIPLYKVWKTDTERLNSNLMEIQEHCIWLSYITSTNSPAGSPSLWLLCLKVVQ